jgi:hypothetical protein
MPFFGYTDEELLMMRRKPRPILPNVAHGDAAGAYASPGGPSVYLQDAFTRANGAIGTPDIGPAYSGTDLVSLGYTLAAISGNKIVGGVTPAGIVASPGHNQAVQFTYSGTGSFVVTLRALPDVGQADFVGYQLSYNYGVNFLALETDSLGSIDTLATSPSMPVSGDVIYASISGSELTVKINGVTVMHSLAAGNYQDRAKCALLLYAATAFADNLTIYTL